MWKKVLVIFTIVAIAITFFFYQTNNNITWLTKKCSQHDRPNYIDRFCQTTSDQTPKPSDTLPTSVPTNQPTVTITSSSPILIPTQAPTQLPIPQYHLIKTTFIPQAPEKNWDQPWQDACEEAALLTSVYYFKNQSPDIATIKQDILDLVDYQTQTGWLIDINLSQMSQIATNYYGLKANILLNPTIDEIKTYISQDTPVLVPANGKILYRENKHFKDGGPYYHAITILGYDDAKKQFIVHDVGTQHGAYFTYSYQTLMESIHDLPPSGDKHDINQGQSAVMVLKSV